MILAGLLTGGLLGLLGELLGGLLQGLGRSLKTLRSLRVLLGGRLRLSLLS